jgi:hypothetical protein
VRLVSPNKHRGITRGAAIRHTEQVHAIRETVRLAVASASLQDYGVPVSIQFTRLAPRQFDSDNLVSAFKPVRDGLCEALGFDDRVLVIAEPRAGVQCLFAHRSAGSRVYAVELLLTWADPVPLEASGDSG